MDEHTPHHHTDHTSRPYWHLALMLALSTAAMYCLMYAMVDDFGSVFANVNQLYMALLMAAPMGIIEIAVMRSMYSNQRLNGIVIVGSVILLLGSWLAIREQAAVADRQFLRSMIPHHSGAILMCERADLSRPEIRQLCRAIVESQRTEIDQMKALLNTSTN